MGSDQSTQATEGCRLYSEVQGMLREFPWNGFALTFSSERTSDCFVDNRLWGKEKLALFIQNPTHRRLVVLLPRHPVYH